MSARTSIIASAIALLAVAGCGSSRLASFPEFPSHKARLGKSVIIADFLVMKATSGDTASVDLGANKAVADTLLHFIQDHLDGKGYNVANRLLSSVGLLLDSTFTANVSHTSELDREGEDAAIFFHPPFYLYQALRRDPGLRFLLAGLYRKLARMEDVDGRYPVMEEIIPLGKALGGGMVFIFMGGGFEVSPGAALSETKPPAAEENAKIGYQNVSQASLHMFVIDSGTGNVLWTDRRILRGGMVYNDKFIRMAGQLLEDLP